ncbi:MAG: gamma-glutamyltransferase family protein [Acidobacteriota bacterium]
MMPSTFPSSSLSHQRRMRFLVASGLVLLLATASPAVAASKPAEAGSGGAVVTEHVRATEVGLQILAAGGNAVDAAVASALALAVVYPEAGNLGGGGFAVIKVDGELAALDFREVAPAAATEDMFLGEDGEPLPETSIIGPKAAGVPGSPAGLEELHQRFGALPWAVVVEPARRLAHDGFLVDDRLADYLLEEISALQRFPETVAQWLPGGAPPAVGTRIRLPQLAATLGLYAEGGAAALAQSEAAQRMEEISTRHGGVLTAADLAAYRPQWRDPVRHRVFGWEIAGMPLPSSGGAIVGQVTRVLEHSEWAQHPRFGAQRAHWLAESFRYAFADRYRMGDPSSTELFPEEMIADEAVTNVAGAIDERRATVSTSLHPALAAPEPSDTTHLSVADASGNLVALTTTLNGAFGSAVWVPGLGFLNNEMDDFAAAPGRPNLYGLVQGKANAVGPGKRMLSSMSPTIAWRPAPTEAPPEGSHATANGAPAAKDPETIGGPESPYVALALGGRGGSRIPTNVLGVLLHLLVDEDDLQSALDRPRIHHQWLPDQIEVEGDTFAPETRAVLESLGHSILVADPDDIAKVQAVALRADGLQEAAADPRSSGVAGVLEGSQFPSP